ncbi:MAG: FAD-dependent oxidoreductase [Porticoccaceae bacterium]|nr:FAD-dependent oxidoreductase [Porticoccaceae bacterium]|tara:strand:+ start:4657 stop:5883 length:1227 start_codon:yes stop_codon:yes gene_type:complete
MEVIDHVVIIGASHAAVQLMISLRQQGWLGGITVISDELHMPYQRPPLSKAYLDGSVEEGRLALRAPEMYEKLDAVFKLGHTVVAIDVATNQITLDTGEKIAYTKLALCTGARVRQLALPGAELGGVHYLRTMDDVKGIRQSAKNAKRAVIIGGGYIGLETAASLTKLGIKVTVLETESRLLKRVASEQVSEFYKRLHEEEGVEIRLGSKVVALQGDGQVRSVICDDDTYSDADMVIIGVGVIPNTELASEAGLVVENGIVVDEFAQTSHPDIVAAGDCTFHPNALLKRSLRLESVPNASEQAKAAAASLCGIKKAYSELPWFWSDQFDVKLQIVGISQGYTEAVVRGDTSRDRSFTVFYIKDQHIIAADCINRPKDFMMAKKLILQQSTIDVAALVDEGIDIKTLIN